MSTAGLRSHARELRSRVLGDGPGRRKILDSTAWTLGERVITLAVSWAVSIAVANYLGVDGFGQLLYVIALVSLFGTFVTAGLSGLVVRDLVREHDHRHEILGTTFAIRLIAGVLAVAVLLLSTFVFGSSPSNRVLIVIVSLGLCFQVTEVIGFWFQSQTRLRHVSVANIVGTLVGACARLAVVAADGSLVAFAWVFALEQAVTGAVLLLTYRRTAGSFRSWSFEWPRARAYLTQSWPLMLSGVASTINLRVDQVLLGVMDSSAAVGTYAVAARLSEVWYFVPTAIGSAVFPSVIRAKDQGEEVYRRRLQQLYGALVWSAIGVAVFVTIVGGPLIRLLYDREYWDAAGVLVVHVWTAPFLFMGVLFSKWLIIEGLLYSSLVRHGFAAVLNVALNLLLIPAHGPTGSAIATLISYAAATYGACFLSRKTRPAGIDMTIGFLLPFRLCANAVTRRR